MLFYDMGMQIRLLANRKPSQGCQFHPGEISPFVDKTIAIPGGSHNSTPSEAGAMARNVT
jgi:hypothetical protein